MGFPGGCGKESACNAGDVGQEDLLEGEMATHSSILAWKIPWTEEPGGLQSVNYKLALAKSVCQQLNNKGVCHLLLRRLNSVLQQLLTFNTPEGVQGGE